MKCVVINDSLITAIVIAHTKVGYPIGTAEKAVKVITDSLESMHM